MEGSSPAPRNPRRARLTYRDVNFQVRIRSPSFTHSNFHLTFVRQLRSFFPLLLPDHRVLSLAFLALIQKISQYAAIEDPGDMDGMVEDDADVESGNESGYEAVPEVGMVFRTHQEVSKFYKNYARRIGFGVSVRRSSFAQEGHCLYLELMCCKGGRKRPEPKFRKRTTATTNCPARIRVKLWGDGLLHLELASLDHNHPVSPSMSRFLNCYKHLSGFEKKDSVPSHEGDAPPIEEQSAHNPFDKLVLLEELLFNESGCRSLAERGRLKLAEGDAESLRLFFTRMQAKNSNFFNVIDLDKEGWVRNVFWADARSRAAYQYYNDVVELDTSYLVSKYDLPLATFVGVNHHGQSVLLGSALLSDVSSETYIWLLKSWISCMLGQFPKAIIMDQCRNIQSAVSDVLPGVRHRLCLWQIMRKVSEKFCGLVEYRLIHKAMQNVVYDSLRVDEFEEEWMKMIEIYGLHENEWLRLLYECRHCWAPVYLKDAFWAGMSITQRNESCIAFFDGYVDANTTLKQFLSKYETALQSKYEKEAQADFETFHKRRPSVSKFYMEEQLSKVYTLNVFKKFQDEIEAIMYCHASLIKVEGSISTFDVKECIFFDDGKKTMNRNHGVLYNSEERDVQCICGSFQFRGILCRHALSVFKLQQAHEIPSQYVLDRWKKDFKVLHVLNRPSDDVVSNNRIDRYDYLSMRCLQLVEVGILSDKYQLALKLVKEMEKFLLSDGTYDETHPKIVSLVNKPTKPDIISTESMGDAISLENGKEEHQRRGRLPHLKNPQEGVKPITMPTVQMSPQQLIGNQISFRQSVVYMFPGGFNPQTFTNGPMLPWIYQQICQGAHPPGTTPDQARKRRKIARFLKTNQAAANPNDPRPSLHQACRNVV